MDRISDWLTSTNISLLFLGEPSSFVSKYSIQLGDSVEKMLLINTILDSMEGQG
jgi:hypothetical protein